MQTGCPYYFYGRLRVTFIDCFFERVEGLGEQPNVGSPWSKAEQRI